MGVLHAFANEPGDCKYGDVSLFQERSTSMACHGPFAIKGRTHQVNEEVKHIMEQHETLKKGHG